MGMTPFKTKVDFASLALLVFFLFGFLGNVMLDYNWGTNPVTNSFALAYTATLRKLIPFPVGYYGVGAAMYLLLLLVSFYVLNRREPSRKNFLETLSLAGMIVVVFELGLGYFVPYFMDKWVIDAVRNTPLQALTNWDLLTIGAGLIVVSQLLLHIRRPEGTV